MPFRMQPMPFPIPALFNIAVKDICAINTFEKLFHILLSEVYCSHFGFTTLLLSATTTDMSLYEVLNLFPRWPLVLSSCLAHRPWCSNSPYNAGEWFRGKSRPYNIWCHRSNKNNMCWPQWRKWSSLWWKCW